MIGAVPLEDVPPRAVVKREVIPYPRGGVVVVDKLECGHQQWRRVPKQPTRGPRPLLCTACWLDKVFNRRKGA